MAYSGEELRRIAELVDAETRRQGLLVVRERVERQIERGVRVVRDPRDVNLGRSAVTTSTNGASTAVGPRRETACRTDGCEHRANAKYDRGPYFGLCYEACIPRKREELSALQIQSRAERRGERRVPDPEPPAVRVLDGPPGRLTEPELPTMDDDPEEREPSLAALAADLERARLIADDAEEAYEEAVERFLDHPLVRELDVGYPAGE